MGDIVTDVRRPSVFALLLLATLFVMQTGISVGRADGPITCENSDYNCIYVVDGGNRIVCTRSFCGGDPSEYERNTGKKVTLEGLYAFDGGDIYNHPTSTTSFTTTTTTIAGQTTVPSNEFSLTLSGDYPFTITRWGGIGSCSYTYALYTDSGYSNAWNALWSPQTLSCNGEQSWSWGNLSIGTTYYFRETYTDQSRTISATHSFTVPAATTTTLDPSAPTTTTIPIWSPSQVSPDNPCLRSGYVCGWALVSPNGQVGGVIVCTIDVCWYEWHGLLPGTNTRLVLQSQQMEGGNVAGRGGGTYDSNTNTFNSGDGTSVGGGKLEDFVPNLPGAVTTFPGAVGVVTSDGEIYANKTEYLTGESIVEVKPDSIYFTVPNTFEDGSKYSVSFDPDGPRPEVKITEGVVNNGSDEIVKLSSTRALQQTVSARSGLHLTIQKSTIGKKSGNLKIKIFGYRGNKLFQTNLAYRAVAPKIYGTCAKLWKDFASGVSSISKSTSSLSYSARVKYGRPIIDKSTYVANKRLDVDKDKIVCERG